MLYFLTNSCNLAQKSHKQKYRRQSYKINLVLKKDKISLKILDGALPQFRLN